jgi:hypothetical protein
MTMTFGGKSFSWSFLLAAVDFPILGADFLSHFGLLVDLQKGSLGSKYFEKFSHTTCGLRGSGSSWSFRSCGFCGS